MVVQELESNQPAAVRVEEPAVILVVAARVFVFAPVSPPSLETRVQAAGEDLAASKGHLMLVVVAVAE
jgi:hypothetical protein